MYVMQQQAHAPGAGPTMSMAGGGGPGPVAGTGISISLVQSALWSQFHQAQTEMIVTKTGRKLFPKLEISIQGLHPGRMYGVHMRLERADEKKYRYTCSKWSASNDDDDACFPQPPPIESNEGFAQLGDFWTAKAIEFSNFKITNNQEESGRGMILVQTLHKYVPVIYIYEMIPGASYANLEPAFLHKEVLHLAEFITVTAYQNEAIKTLKTAHNPFAKGCRGAAAKPALQQSPTDTRPISLKRAYSPAPSFGLHGHRSPDGAPCSKLASPAFPMMDPMQPSPSYTVPPTVSQPQYPTPPPESPSTVVPDHQAQQQHHPFEYPQMGFFDPRYMMMPPFYPSFFPGMPSFTPQQPPMEYLQQMQQQQEQQQQQQPQQYLPAPYTPHNHSETDSSSSNGNSPANSQ